MITFCFATQQPFCYHALHCSWPWDIDQRFIKLMKGSVHFLEELLKAKIALGSQNIVWKELVLSRLKMSKESLHDLKFFLFNEGIIYVVSIVLNSIVQDVQSPSLIQVKHPVLNLCGKNFCLTPFQIYVSKYSNLSKFAFIPVYLAKNDLLPGSVCEIMELSWWVNKWRNPSVVTWK